MPIQRADFYAHLRKSLFAQGLSASQVAGHEAILDHWHRVMPGGDRRYLAYMLATTFHESAKTMRPVRETLADNDTEAIARLEKAYAAGRLPWVRTPYWRLDGEGKSWLGRGLVQLTHKANYQKLGALVGEDITTDPGQAMVPDTALKIMFEGMLQGVFTGHSLSDYFNASITDWRGARRIINGTERAGHVAAIAKAYHQALI